MRRKTKGIILAGNYEQYKTWCKKRYLNLDEYIYISEPKDIKGIHNVPVYYVGQYWDNCLYKSEILSRIEYENARRKNMVKYTWLQLTFIILTIIIMLSISVFGIWELIDLLENLSITYFIRL